LGPAAPPDFPIPLGRYELLAKLASGGMATVYLARGRGPQQFAKLLTIKVIQDCYADEVEFIAMFLDEARIALRIDHPHVATLFELGEITGRHFLVMEYVHGQSLAELIAMAARQGFRIPWPYVARIVADAASGLHAAHELRDVNGSPLHVVHRDVSPSNVLVSYAGHVKVLDFGIAAATGRLGRTRTGQIRGKIPYMSPEQIQGGALDRRSDIFSLGVLLHEALSQKRLFKRDHDAAAAQAILGGDVPALPAGLGLPPVLTTIVMKALAQQPEHRYATAGELVDDLESLLVTEGQVVTSSTIGRLLDRLFPQEREQREHVIQQCLALPSRPEAPREVEGNPPGAPNRQTRAMKRWALLSIPLSLLVVLAVGLGIGLTRRAESSGEDAPAAAPTISPMALPSRAQPSSLHDSRTTAPLSSTPRSRIHLVVSVSPRKANPVIEFRGQTLRGHTLDRRVRKSERRERVRIRAPGYDPKTLEVRLTKDVRYEVALTPRAARARRRDPQPRRTRRRIHPPRRRGTLLREPDWAR
jgi:serine/threonine-protein kinase